MIGARGRAHDRDVYRSAVRALPVVIVALVIAVYRAVVLWMNRSQPADWTWPPAETNFPIRLNKRQFQITSIAGIVAMLLVAVWALLRFT